MLEKRPKIKSNIRTSITIHNTAGNGKDTPESVIRWWEDERANGACAHIVIGKDGSSLMAVPYDEIAWHSGCPKGNETSIGIEVCEKDSTGEFSEASILTLKEVISEIQKIYPMAKNIVRHWDWTNSRYENGHKECPRFYTGSTDTGQKRWEKLKNDIV